MWFKIAIKFILGLFTKIDWIDFINVVGYVAQLATEKDKPSEDKRKEAKEFIRMKYGLGEFVSNLMVELAYGWFKKKVQQ